MIAIFKIHIRPEAVHICIMIARSNMCKRRKARASYIPNLPKPLLYCSSTSMVPLREHFPFYENIIRHHSLKQTHPQKPPSSPFPHPFLFIPNNKARK